MPLCERKLGVWLMNVPRPISPRRMPRWANSSTAFVTVPIDTPACRAIAR